MSPRTRTWRAAAAAAVAACALGACGSSSHRDVASVDPALPAPAADVAATASVLGPWHLVGHTTAFGPSSDGGVVTVGGQVVYRGELSATATELAQGWDHLGDPDAMPDGTIVDAFQGGPGTEAKMFLLTAPSGATRELVHPLDRGELANNSFAALAPDGRYLVAGEWWTERRLLVFPDPEAAGDGPYRRVGDIDLDRAVTDLQGCDFVTATRLLCVSGEAPFPLLQVDLPAPLDGRAVDAAVTDLGDLPTVSRCQGTFEPEGIDYEASTGTLRVEVQPPAPCSVSMTVYDYRQG